MTTPGSLRGRIGVLLVAALVATTATAVPATAATASTAPSAPVPSTAQAAPATPPTTAPDGASTYPVMPQDPTAVVLGSAEFPVHGDGVGDDTAVIQAAIDEASRRGGENWLGNIVGGARGLEVGDGGGLVFVPEGTYRVTDRIDVRASVRLIGFGQTRPEFVVTPGTPAYAGDPEFVFAAVRRPFVEGGPVTFGNNDTFATGLVNVDITVGPGNPGAVGVRFGGAQMFLLQDVDIDMGDGHAAVDHNANLLQRVNVTGGRYGLLAFAASPGWQTTIVDSTFTGQSEAAILLHTDAKLSIIRNRFTDMPRAIEAIPGQTQRLYVQDSVFERVTGPVITLNDSESIPAPEEPELVRGQNQLNVVSSGVVDSGPLLRTMPSARTWTLPEASYLVREATLGLRVENALGDDERRTDEVLIDTQAQAPQALEPLLTTDMPLPPDSGTWVNIAEYAAERGVTIGAGADDHAIFQQALAEHDTVYVPMGSYVLSDTLNLRTQNNLIGLHPRQTWLTIEDESPAFADTDAPRALVETPLGGRNVVSGLGLDTAETNPGSVHVRWRSGEQSHLSDVTTQFVKWAPEETAPGDPALGDPGYDHRGDYKYNFWVDGGGGTFLNLWAVAGYAENGFLVEDTAVRGRVYEISVEHHRHREVVLRDVANWELHALQTEDHIYGWESQAVELDGVRDVLLANTVLFRVATVLGPYPYAIGVRDSSDVVVRGTRGYRPTNIENTRWGATIRDVETGRQVPELEVAYLAVDAPGREATTTGVSVAASPVQLLPGDTAEVGVELTNAEPAPLDVVAVTAEAPDTLEVTVPSAPTVVGGGETLALPVSVTAAEDAALGTDHVVTLTLTVSGGGRTEIEVPLAVRVGGENLALGAPVTASSVLSTNVAANTVDGLTTGGRWISGSGDPAPTLTIDLGAPADLFRLVLYSGVTGSTALRVDSVEVDGLVGDTWRPIGRLTGNTASPATIRLDDADGVSQVRVRFTRPSPTDGLARVFETEVYGTR